MDRLLHQGDRDVAEGARVGVGPAQDGDIETALIFGTLKALPAQLLPNIDGFWIENGNAGQMKEAA